MIRLSDDRRWLEADGRRFPVLTADVSDFEANGELLFRTRRAVVRTEAGFELSIVWGTATWSSNRDALWPWPVDFIEEPDTVEVAVFDRAGDMVGGEPAGYITAAELCALIDDLQRAAEP